MREILFRGKSLHDGEWLYGAYYKQEEYYGDPWNAHYIITSKDELDDNMMLFESVIPETVGQYTGLTDKNGDRIFEDDIVEIHVSDLVYRGWVFYGERAARWGVVLQDSTENYSFLQQPLIGAYSIIVIGNIHDNTELMKGGEGDGKMLELHSL